MTFRLLGFAICLAAWPALGQTAGGEHHADRQGALGVAKGPAAAEIRDALTARTQSCNDMDSRPKRCALTDTAFNADVQYGVIGPGDRRIAFVSVRWQSDPTGNAVDATGLIFVADDGTPFRLLGQIDLAGDSVSDVIFDAKRITYATRYLRPDDARANPTGRRRYEIPFKADGIGPVAIQRSGFSASAGSTQPEADDALALVKRLYEAGPGYEDIFDAKRETSPWLSPGLVAVIRQAMALSRRCMIYDGDPRLAGAQGAGGPVRMRYHAGPAGKTDDRRNIRVTAAQAEAPKLISEIEVSMVRTPSGWRVDNLSGKGGKSYRDALAEAYARCRKAAL